MYTGISEFILKGFCVKVSQTHFIPDFWACEWKTLTVIDHYSLDDRTAHMDNSDVKKLNFQLKYIFNLSGMLKIFKHHSILSSILICHII